MMLNAFICAFGDEDPVWGSYVDNLPVAYGHHREGVGSALMCDAAVWLSRVHPDRGVYLWVMEANAPARSFYERLGAAHAGMSELADPAAAMLLTAATYGPVLTDCLARHRPQTSNL